jgi:hypothetical protein
MSVVHSHVMHALQQCGAFVTCTAAVCTAGSSVGTCCCDCRQGSGIGNSECAEASSI